MTSRVCPISQASRSKSFGASLLISAALLFSSQLALAQTEFPIPTPNSVPSGITVGPEVPVGALWFTETGDPALGPKVRGKIGRITTAGVITEFPIPTLNSAPNGITTGPDGALWFAEGIGNKIGCIPPATATPTDPQITEFTIPLVDSGHRGARQQYWALWAAGTASRPHNQHCHFWPAGWPIRAVIVQLHAQRHG
jgi:streptogramin lyase